MSAPWCDVLLDLCECRSCSPHLATRSSLCSLASGSCSSDRTSSRSSSSASTVPGRPCVPHQAQPCLPLGLTARAPPSQTVLEQIKAVFTGREPLAAGKIAPTVGLNIGRLQVRRAKLIFWDLGGQSSLRAIWEKCACWLPAPACRCRRRHASPAAHPPTLRVHDCARGCTGVMASVPLRPYHQRIPTSVDPPWAQMIDTAACPRAEPPFWLGTQVLLGGAWAYLRSRRRRPHAPGRGEHTAGELVTRPAVAFGWSRLARASLLLCSGVYLCLGPAGAIRSYHPPALYVDTTRGCYLWIPFGLQWVHPRAFRD